MRGSGFVFFFRKIILFFLYIYSEPHGESARIEFMIKYFTKVKMSYGANDIITNEKRLNVILYALLYGYNNIYVLFYYS